VIIIYRINQLGSNFYLITGLLEAAFQLWRFYTAWAKSGRWGEL